MKKYHDSRVKPRTFQVNDLVLRRADVQHGNAGVRKLAPKWEGPFKVVDVLPGGAFRLHNMEGTELPHPWSIENLRRYYQ